jgi:hypothetical protein
VLDGNPFSANTDRPWRRTLPNRFAAERRGQTVRKIAAKEELTTEDDSDGNKRYELYRGGRVNSSHLNDLSGSSGCRWSLPNRGRLKAGAFADVVIFDPATFQDHSTYAKPMQYAIGVTDVFINGRLALKDGEPTGAHTGHALRGRAWTGAGGGGCRAVR